MLLQLLDLPPESQRVDVSFLQAGSTLETRSAAPLSSLLLTNVPPSTDEVYLAARQDGLIIAESYANATVSVGRTTSVAAQIVTRQCRAPEGVAKEIINQVSIVTVIAGGDTPIGDTAWETYTPSPPYEKNSDRHTLFTDSCLYRSFDKPWDAPPDELYTYIPHDGFSWLRLARTLAVENLPATETVDRVPPPGHVQVIVIEKCQQLVFTGQIWEMHDPYGNVYVMHANPDGQPDTESPSLPSGWHIETRLLSEQLVLNPRGKDSRYTLIKDDQDQAYHQYVFDGVAGLSQAVSPDTAELLDEN